MVIWTVDDRAPTWWARLYVAGMRAHRDKDAFEGAEHTLARARRLQEAGDAPPTRWTRLRCAVRTRRLAGMTVWVVRPRRGTPAARVLYLHGGGYLHPVTPDYWRLVRALVAGGAEVVLPAYPLAPGATVDDVLPRLVELAAEDDGPGRIIMGDSAGGALALAVTCALRDDDGPLPDGIVALCPWLDGALAEDEVASLEATDPMLAESGLRTAARAWAGDRPLDDPMVSPVHADLSGLPPLDVLIGDRDILRPGVDLLAERATDDVALRVHEVTSMFHVWMTRALPEGRRTRRMLRQLVTERAGG